MEGTDGPNTFSSALMRQRDQIVEDKHRKEKDTLNARVHKLKMANEDTLKEFFDLSNRCGRMVRMLGFKDISEAEAAIEAADGVQLFKEFLERGDQLEDDLASERAKSDKLFEEAATLKQEKEKLKADVASAERKLERTQSDAARQQAKAERLTTELNQLKSRYDTLSDVRERCAVKYKKDYATWRNMKDWIFDDSGLDGLDLTEKARKSKMNALVKEKKQIIKDHHARGDEASEPAPHPPLGDVDFVEEEEEIQSTTPRERKHSTSQPSSPSPQDEEPPSPQAMKQEANPSARKSLFKPGTNELLSSSPSPFNDYPPRKSSSTRTPLTFEPIGKLMPKQWSPNQRDLSTTHPPTSQTEPESPERNPHAMENHAPTSPASSPPHIASSQTEPESQSQYFAFPPPTFPPKSTPRPLTTMNMVPRTVPARIGGGAVVSRDPETMQPIKMLKLGDHPATSPRRKPPHRIPAMFANSSTPSQSRKPLGSKENRPFLAPTSTPMNSKENVPKPGDYSAFKGRGRYAKEATVGKGTINAQFMIDPERNGGVNHQFNEVVRNKRERQQMDAGDCDCCRGYYEAVGPLPARMQAPLWRSPEKNKKMTHSPSCKHHGKASGLEDDNDDMQDEIGEHHKAVSRHRHHWARANTPPGYWEIGFPNTQEAEDINEKAREMHEKKRQEVDAAARREGGRYRRRT